MIHGLPRLPVSPASAGIAYQLVNRDLEALGTFRHAVTMDEDNAQYREAVEHLQPELADKDELKGPE